MIVRATWLRVALASIAFLVACLPAEAEVAGREQEMRGARWRQAVALTSRDQTRATSLILVARRAGLQPADFCLRPDAVDEQLVQIMAALEADIAEGNLGPIPAGVHTYYVVRPIGGTHVERAYEELVRRDMLRRVTLILLDADVGGVEKRIYDSMKRRKFRATTGPDEGIDASGVPGCPRCIFVPRDDANVISIASWQGILIHEKRHLSQAAVNTTLAMDFRGDAGQFTSYAAFCEACADDGLFTTPMYRSRERLAQLREVVGAENAALLEQACRGDKTAYSELALLHDSLVQEPGAFEELFRPYW